ncbi:MAG: hypothetical protein JWN38_404 [Candidatus Saccharibacteria bacterium]|nr:hypothetical protein [Candidatus Saccharibacteria bacterium]
MTELVLIAHNLRSTHNVGSLLRTAEGLGVRHVYLTGYTPYPAAPADARLPHLAQKMDRAISKTALGAEKTQAWTHDDSIFEVLETLRAENYIIAAIEQTPNAIKLPDYRPPRKLALIVGREVEGIEPEVLSVCDEAVEIPMFGKKESFNVVQAAAMALYHCRLM